MEKAYKLSFTAGGLLYQQTIEITARYRAEKSRSWMAIRNEVMAGSLLHATRASTRNRYFFEIQRRLQSAHEFEIDYIANEKEGARLALFALCCRYYNFLGEFMEEIIQGKLAIGDTTLTVADFYSFFERKAETHEELRNITESSRRKVQSVLFHMLAEAGIMDRRTKRISAPMLPAELTEQYHKAGDYVALMHLLHFEGDQP